MNRELAWSMFFVAGVGIIGCGGDSIDPDGKSFVDPVEEEEPEPTANSNDEPVETPDPDPGQTSNNAANNMAANNTTEPDPIAAPAIRCTENVVDENPYPQQLPGWNVFEFDVQIAPEVTSFQIVGYNDRNNGAAIEWMELPDGTEVDHWSDPVYSRYLGATFYTTEGNVGAVPFPATPGAEVQTGSYTFRGLSQDAKFCYYVVERTSPGVALQLNVFFVGVDGLDAQSAATDEDWQEAAEVVANTFAAAGLEVRFNYIPISSQLVEEHDDPRSFENLNSAVRELAEEAGPLPMESIDVFIWEEFNGEVGQMHGMARGLPEATGLHGEVGNGVALQTMGLLGFEGVVQTGEIVGNIEIGLTISHEIGHALGLFHTSEFYASSFDLAEDTPECQNASQTLSECPDATNLMFPLGPMYMSSELSEEQIAVLTAHPSVARE